MIVRESFIGARIRDRGINGKFPGRPRGSADRQPAGVLAITTEGERPMSSGKTSRVAFVLSGLVMLLAGSTAALAEGEPQARAAGIQEIVVTAQRRVERLQDVPIAVTAISEEQAEKRGITTTDDLQIATPALTITRVNQAPLFYLRGVGTANQLPNEEPSIPLYVDGFYASAGAGSIMALNSIERVEVLKGPQGTLFGRNGTGGLINIVTKTPSRETGGKFSLGYGNYSTADASFYGTTGFGQSGAVDFAALYSDRGSGFGQNVLLGSDVGLNREVSLRSKALWEFTDKVKLTVSGSYARTVGDYGMTTQVAPGVLAFDGVTRYAGDQNISANRNPSGEPKDWAVTTRLDWDLGFGTLINMAQYRDNHTFYTKDVDGIPVDRSTAAQYEFTRTVTEELQLQSPVSSKFQWVTGLFYLNGAGGANPLYVGGNQFAPLGLAQQIRIGIAYTDSYAGFAQATMPLGDRARLTLGARYTKDHKTLVGSVVNQLASGALVTSVAGPPAGNSPLDSSKFTYRAALDYKLQDDVMLYGVVSRGYKAGSFNVLAIVDPPVQPETLDAVEAGIKSEWLQRRLQLNVALYDYDYKNIQLSQLSAATAGGSGGIKILNATTARIYGGEVELVGRPSQELTLSGSLAYVHGRYGTFLGAPFAFPAPWNCATNSPLNPNGTTAAFPARNSQCTGDASGFTVVRTPKLSGSLGANYDVHLSRGTLGLNVSASYNDGFYWEVDNRVRQGSYMLVNGDVRWTEPTDHWTVRLWGRNLANKLYFVGESSSNNDQLAAGAPRTFGVGFTYSF
jgi:iron complex outermembrane recepter protein